MLSIEPMLSSKFNRIYFWRRKLSRYRALGVQEVWFWEDGLFALYNLGADGCDRTNSSELLPELDCDLLASVRDEFDRGCDFGVGKGDRACAKVKGRSKFFCSGRSIFDRTWAF
jgi:hypothetical protein